MTASRLTTESHQYAPMPSGAVLALRIRISAAAISSAVKNTNISTMGSEPAIEKAISAP